MTNNDTEKQRLLETVRAYAELASEKGFVEAARVFLAEDAILLAADHAPIKGCDAICEYLVPLAGLNITWAPFYVDRLLPAIWRKQPDSEGRCVFDAGHSGPPPT